VPIAAIKGSIAGLPLIAETDYLSFESMRELAQGAATVIDPEKCDSGFDSDDRGRLPI
jgi:hypothetical protein